MEPAWISNEEPSSIAAQAPDILIMFFILLFLLFLMLLIFTEPSLLADGEIASNMPRIIGIRLSTVVASCKLLINNNLHNQLLKQDCYNSQDKPELRA
jgi:hypothetical protein